MSVEEVGLATAAAVVAVEVVGHEDAAAALRGGALLAQTRDLAGAVNLVHLEESELHLLVHVGHALGLGVHLLLALLTATAETEHEVKGGLLLDVVIREGSAIFELLAREDQALLVGGDALLVLDLGLDVVDGVGRLNLEGDGLTGDCNRGRARGYLGSARPRRRGGRNWWKKSPKRPAPGIPAGRGRRDCGGALTGLYENLHVCLIRCSALVRRRDVGKGLAALPAGAYTALS